MKDIKIADENTTGFMLHSFEGVDISEESMLPTIVGFDMNFRFSGFDD